MSKEEQGFTLIELVVVMAIIAVLAALMVAAISAARKQADSTQRMGNTKTLETATETFSAKNGGKYPTYGASQQVVVADVSAGTGLQTFLVSVAGKTVLSGNITGLDSFYRYVGNTTGTLGTSYVMYACSSNTTATVDANVTVGSTSWSTTPCTGGTVVYITAR
jgi:prepilin-type N-terminal cleavage/methylation domain-containing protein